MSVVTAHGDISQVSKDAHWDKFSFTGSAVISSEPGKRMVVVSWSGDEPLPLGARIHVTINIENEAKEAL